MASERLVSDCSSKLARSSRLQIWRIEAKTSSMSLMQSQNVVRSSGATSALGKTRRPSSKRRGPGVHPKVLTLSLRMLEFHEALATASGSWTVSYTSHEQDMAVVTEVTSPLDPNGEPTKPDLNIVDVNMNGTFYSWKLATHYFRKQAEADDRDRCFIITGSMVAWIDSPVSHKCLGRTKRRCKLISPL